MPKMKRFNYIFTVLLIIIGTLIIVSIYFLSVFILEDIVRPSSEFAIIVLPDTQIYAWRNNTMLESQIDWILKAKDKLNIKYVIQLGDLVQHHDNESQWQYVNHSFSKLDGKIPYMVTTGNHDGYGIIDTEVWELYNYNRYFPVERFIDDGHFQGYYISSDNAYSYFSAGEKDYMIITLGNCPRSDIVNWAEQIVKENSDREVIFVSHSILNGKNAFTNDDNDKINCRSYDF